MGLWEFLIVKVKFMIYLELSLILNKKLDSEYKTSIYLIMEFIKEQLNIDYFLYKEINDEYYKWSLD